jgi:hypothetical protein
MQTSVIFLHSCIKPEALRRELEGRRVAPLYAVSYYLLYVSKQRWLNVIDQQKSACRQVHMVYTCTLPVDKACRQVHMVYTCTLPVDKACRQVHMVYTCTLPVDKASRQVHMVYLYTCTLLPTLSLELNVHKVCRQVHMI